MKLGSSRSAVAGIVSLAALCAAPLGAGAMPLDRRAPGARAPQGGDVAIETAYFVVRRGFVRPRYFVYRRPFFVYRPFAYRRPFFYPRPFFPRRLY